MNISKQYKMRNRVVVAPTSLPITLADVKLHLRLETCNDDDYITELIKVATELSQEFCQRKFITQTLEGYLDANNLLTTWWEGTIVAAISAVGSLRTIELPWLPVQSVTGVSLFSLDDTEYLVDSLSYRVDYTDLGRPARITLKESAVWPGGSYRNQNSLKVTWVAGYGTPIDVPAGIRQGVKMLVGYLYNNRGDCSGDCVGACGANSVLQPYRVLSL